MTESEIENKLVGLISGALTERVNVQLGEPELTDYTLKAEGGEVRVSWAGNPTYLAMPRERRLETKTVLPHGSLEAQHYVLHVGHKSLRHPSGDLYELLNKLKNLLINKDEDNLDPFQFISVTKPKLVNEAWWITITIRTAIHLNIKRH